MILLTGLGSSTGLRVAKKLLKSGHGFSALVRDAGKIPELKSKKVTLVKGSIDDSDSLRKAMDGIENALLISSLSENQYKIEKNFIDTAKKAGVKHIVKFSAIGADPDSPSLILRNHGQSEKYLKKSGLKYTIVKPNIFMQNFMDFYGNEIKKTKQLKLPLKNAKCSYVDLRDTVRLLTKVLTTNGNKNKTHIVTGPESLSCFDVAERFSEAIGKKIKYVEIKPKEFKKDMLDVGVSESTAEAFTDLYKIAREGIYNEVTDDIYKVTDRQPHTFDEFIDDNIKFFIKS